MKRQDLPPKIPDTPGVYFFKKEKTILYIGKATSLRDRIKSYFGNDLLQTRGPLLVDMVTKSKQVTFQECASVLEALVTEASLIKKYQPYYNTKEKDDKSHYFVCVTKDDHPLVILERGKNIDFVKKRSTHHTFSSLFGPFPSGPMIREGLQVLRKIFPFDDDSSIKKSQKSFYQQIALSPRQSGALYRQTIGKLKLFLGGKTKSLALQLKREMRSYAKRQEFERASQSRNQLFALEHLNDVSLMKREENSHTQVRIEGYDIAHISGTHMVGGMVVIENGEKDTSSYRKFIIRSVRSPNDPAALREALSRRLNHPEWKLPNIIVVDGNAIQRNSALKVLQEYHLDIPVIAVTKDTRHKPKALVGEHHIITNYRDQILLANSEAHRYVVSFHRKRREHYPKKSRRHSRL